MLVYITNRKLKNVPKTAPTFNTVKKDIYKSEVGYELNRRQTPAGDHIYFGVSTNAGNTRFKFYPRGSEQSLFDSIDPAEYKKPWVVLLHGYHQDVTETIKKAAFLIDHHGVNVVLFSWPSRPKPVDAFDAGILEDYIRDLALSIVYGFGRPDLLNIFRTELRNWLKDFVNNYKPARKNARDSSTDFYNALSVLEQQLKPRLNKGVSLFVHSMGNYLLRRTISEHDRLPMTFCNVVLHQADVDAADHASWVPRLAPAAGNSLYITVNVFDYVLAGSNILHRYLLGRDNVERLGQSVRMQADGAYQGYIPGLVEYIDFTDSYGVGVKHEIFTNTGVSIDEPIISDPNDIDEVLFKLIGKIIRCEKDGLRNTPGYGPDKGMSMMPAVPRIHKSRWIVEDENLCEEHRDVCFIDSYDDFQRRNRPQAVFGPEFDD